MVKSSKPHLHYQLGKWHCILPTGEAWGWYVGSHETLMGAFETYLKAHKTAWMINCWRNIK